MRSLKVIGLLAALAACGGPNVSGTIAQACLSADRSAASPALCSCVQRVADNTLSNRDQTRAVAFFAEPQLAQDTRQSDRSGDEAFWLRYKDFSAAATEQCAAVG